jgi:osmoprotectant transport system ATP-binding protein
MPAAASRQALQQVASCVPVGYSRAVADAGTRAAVEFQSVSFSYGRRPILRDVSFAIESGETVVLVGRSGAGKSTVLKLVNRMLLPHAGTVLVGGRPTHEWNPFALRRGIGYVLQDVGLFPHMTVGDNIALVPRLAGWDEARVSRRVGEMLELTGLPPQDFAQRAPDELSGGQKQRVGVARALAADPSILLMDEPFGALDPVTRAELHHELRRIQREVRKTIVLVTHDMGEAFALATRIGVLSDGDLAALDEPARIGRSNDARVKPLLEPLLEASAALESTRR